MDEGYSSSSSSSSDGWYRTSLPSDAGAESSARNAAQVPKHSSSAPAAPAAASVPAASRPPVPLKQTSSATSSSGTSLKDTPSSSSLASVASAEKKTRSGAKDFYSLQDMSAAIASAKAGPGDHLLIAPHAPLISAKAKKVKSIVAHKTKSERQFFSLAALNTSTPGSDLLDDVRTDEVREKYEKLRIKFEEEMASDGKSLARYISLIARRVRDRSAGDHEPFNWDDLDLPVDFSSTVSSSLKSSRGGGAPSSSAQATASIASKKVEKWKDSSEEETGTTSDEGEGSMFAVVTLLENPEIFDSKSVTITLEMEEYIRRVVGVTKIPPECLLIASIYIEKLHAKCRTLLAPSRIHGIVLICMMIASKMYEDIPYANSYWSALSGTFPVEQINEMELTALRGLSFNLNVSERIFRQYAKIAEL